mgnify:CR=1 FL=1
MERVVCRDASQLGVASPEQCSISIDGALIASIDVDYVGALRVTQLDLGDDGQEAVDVRARPCGEASVVCFDCDLTLVKCGEGVDGERIGADPAAGAPSQLDVSILVGAADGRAVHAPDAGAAVRGGARRRRRHAAHGPEPVFLAGRRAHGRRRARARVTLVYC